MTNLILIGYRGTGKTTVGRMLAERLGWAFVDADDEIEARAGKTIAEIFVDEGEPAFRDLEQEVVRDLVQRDRHVVSLGGGAVLREENRQAIRCGGRVIWLTATPEVIHARLNADQTTAQRRPNLTTVGGLAEIEQLLRQREPLYRECAERIMHTEGVSAREIVDVLCQSESDDS